MKNYLIVLLSAAFVIPSTVLAEDPPIEVWVRTGGFSYDDWGEDIAVDASGFVYVTGNTYDGASYNWLTVKYDADGNLKWWKTYDSGYGDDIACAVDVDNSGNVYVVGYTPDNTIHDWRYIKYDSDGTVLWNKIRDWGADVDQGCHDIVVDILSGWWLYMTGDYISPNGTWDYLTVKCDLEGDFVCENTWSGGTGVNNNAWAITMDDAHNIYVSGTVWNTTVDWGTVKYNAFLNTQWATKYDSGTDEFMPTGAIAVDDNTGSVYLAGWSENAGTGTDWQIVKIDTDGTFLWNKTIDTGNNDECARGVAVDDAGYIYVNGDIYSGTDWDCRTMKFNEDSDIQWTVTYDGGNGNDAGRGIAIDDSGILYVVGHSYNGTNHDYVTIKYEQQTGITEQSSGGNSTLPSLGVVNNPAATPTLSYTLPAGMQGRLSFYTVDGRRIEEFSLNQSQSTFTWNTSGLTCGVYFALLESGNLSTSAKICLTR